MKKIFTNPTFDRRLNSNIYKELKKLGPSQPNNPIKKWGKGRRGGGSGGGSAAVADPAEGPSAVEPGRHRDQLGPAPTTTDLR